jgi:hypothetical protein
MRMGIGEFAVRQAMKDVGFEQDDGSTVGQEWLASGLDFRNSLDRCDFYTKRSSSYFIVSIAQGHKKQKPLLAKATAFPSP